jgi:DNA repair protein RecN (Recombination protein N)
MLSSLRIRNLALIEDLTWDLEAGLDILSGETGAGKSILIDAFQLLLGERAERSLIREGEDQCTVEAMLEGMQGLNEKLESLGLEPCDEGQLLIKRVIDREKSGRQFINGSPTTVQMLKEVTGGLVDFHGPHDHQSLLSEREQLRALDAFANLSDDVEAFRVDYQAWQQKRRQWEDLQSVGADDLRQRLELLQFQIREIEDADLKDGEDEDVDQAYRVASASREIIGWARDISRLIEEDEGGLQAGHSKVHQVLESWAATDPALEPLVESHADLSGQLEDLNRELQRRAEAVEIDESGMQALEERLDLIQSLKRKYGGSIESVRAYGEKIQAEHETLSDRDEQLARLQEEGDRLMKKCRTRAKKLGQERREAAGKLAESITAELRGLGFKKAHFEISVEEKEEPGTTGMDRVEFRFAPNPGEGVRALSAIASSGEMARVMLAVKTVLAGVDRVPVLIFDEIDANVGGETASRVAARLRALGGRGHQVLCITHLPQVAAAGNAHYHVSKRVKGARTLTEVKRVEGEARRLELARMLGGENKSSLQLADELIATYQS